MWVWYSIDITTWDDLYLIFFIPIIGQMLLASLLALMLVSFLIELMLWHDIAYYRVSYDNKIERYSVNYDNIEEAKKRIDEFIENDNNVNRLSESRKIVLENKLNKKNKKTKSVNYIKYP